VTLERRAAIAVARFSGASFLPRARRTAAARGAPPGGTASSRTTTFSRAITR